MKNLYFLAFLFLFWHSHTHSFDDYYPFMFIYPAAALELSRDRSNVPENIRIFTMVSLGIGGLLTGISHAVIAYCEHYKKPSNDPNRMLE